MIDGTQFWTNGNGFPGTTVPLARRLEEDGWDGIVVPDSQNLTGDPYVQLALAAAATTRLRVGTAVTNSLTRHPAVAASAIATVNEESGGRAFLGIGRGDSALAHLGLAPDGVASFEQYLRRLQGYLRGEAVDFDVELDGRGRASSSETLGLASAPASSSLKWLKYAHQPKPPVYVVASGPRVIAAAAREADGVVFAVGGDVERLTWAVRVAREAGEAAGRDPEDLVFGAMIPVAVHADAARAAALVSDTAGSYVRFSVMHGRVNGPISDADKQSLLDVHRVYDMHSHASKGPQADAITGDVLNKFSITGDVPHVIDRITELKALGVSKFLLHLGGAVNLKDADAEGRQSSYKDIVERVLPAVSEV